ncbi:hypothetical protein QAD02_022483 [Eretmocerus hayati]|uniref:Uncharacterized protein n=1 Tax=Eretmocerus hayati TaxID=131215 RepID=A0ACC2PVN5_9HYME|nr:hypothetical protein QAD02_022483 [Eretmocerus hayati]
MSKLFKAENSDSDEELNVNTEYAKNYDTWRQKEELHKLKARYGEDVEFLSNAEESSDTSSDDEGEELPDEFEKSFFKTLSCLKNKDPRIYNKSIKFFNEKESEDTHSKTQSKSKKEKTLSLRDYERKIITERQGKFSDSEDENEANNVEHNPTYVQEQEELKNSFKTALLQEEDQDDLLKPKTKTEEEIQKEDKDYKEWLKGQKEDINEDEQKDLKPLKDFWTDPNLDESEKFLRDYILNRKFLDKESTSGDLNYDHMAHDSDDDLSEDEKNINKQEEFEHKFNFRFEEPDQEFIKRYPRTIENSLRKKDTRRAQKRAEVKARKEEEKVRKQEELKQLKALKRKEIEEKIEKLKEITGNDDLQFNMMDFEEDFNPDEYDKKMSQIFNDDYYAEQEGDIKPEFPEIDEELCLDSNWDNYDPSNEELARDEFPQSTSQHCEDPDFNMDADYDGTKDLQSDMIESTKKRKRRRRSKFAEMISKEKPKFDPSQHPSYQEYYDQYYALDYEDMIGDLPCRFKYRQVVPNDFGLSVEEILMADDKELNKWCSLKKALEYKPEHRELNDVRMYKQKAANEALKKKILRSLYEAPEEESEIPSVTPSNNEQNSKKKRKRNRKKTNAETVGDVQEDTSKTSTRTPGTSKSVKNEQLECGDQQIEVTLEPSKIKKGTGKKRKAEDEPKDHENSTPTVKKSKKKRSVKNKNAGSNGNSESHSSVPSTNKNSSVKEKEIQSKKGDSNPSSNSILSKRDRVKQLKVKKNGSTKDENQIALSKKEKRKLLFKKIEKKKEKSKEVNQIASLSDERLKAYGFNPKKFKNKLKYEKKD